MPIRSVRVATLKKEIATAYLAAGTKVGSWVIVSALIFRVSPEMYAILILVRGTIGLLNYTSVGLVPAMIRMIAEARRTIPMAAFVNQDKPAVLAYQSPPLSDPASPVYASGIAVGLITLFLGMTATTVYAIGFPSLYTLPRSIGWEAPQIVSVFGTGIVFRMFGDALGSIVQSDGLIAIDNLVVALGELAWVLLVAAMPTVYSGDELRWVGFSFMISGAVPVFCRWMILRQGGKRLWTDRRLVQADLIRKLLAFGVLVSVAQMADFLYAPTDFILINRLLTNLDLAAYGPAVQIDAGLLFLVSGIAAVLLPRTALAHAADDHKTIARYYIRGTLASTAVLAAAALLVWIAAPLLLKAWLKDPLPLTFTILPLVLIHTVVGGSSAVGRSILLGLGKVKPFTAAVLIAGISNVLLSFFFVRFCHLGLRGIILGTIAAVVGRCAIWMPWYVLKTLKAAKSADFSGETETFSPTVP